MNNDNYVIEQIYTCKYCGKFSLPFDDKDVEKHLTGQQLKELGHICHSINCGRKNEGKESIECVVVESDWPEYEPTWAAIEKRIVSDAAWNFVEQYADSGDSCTDCRFSDQSGPGWGHTCDLGDEGEVTECPALPEYLYPKA